MKKLFLTFILLSFFTLPVLSLDIYIDGEAVIYDESTGLPISENGTVLLPLYHTASKIGATVFQDNPYGTAVVSRNGITVSCKTSDSNIFRNGTEIHADYGLIWRDGPLYVDARFFAFLDADVYVGKESVIITSPPIQPYEERNMGIGSGSIGIYAITDGRSESSKHFGVKYEPKNGVFLGADIEKIDESLTSLENSLGQKIAAYRLYASCSEELSEMLETISEIASSTELIYCVIEEKITGFGGVIENSNVYIEMAKCLEGTGANLIVGFGQNPNCKNTLYGDASGYIERYRSFSEIFREYAPSVATVFSVCGCCGDFEKYYPGDIYIDYVGCSACDNTETQSTLPLRLFEPCMSLYSYKKPIIVTSPLYDYAESYAKRHGLDRNELLLELYTCLTIKYPRIKAAFLLSEPQLENARISSDSAYENALSVGLCASGRFSDSQNVGFSELCTGAAVSSRVTTLYSVIDVAKSNDFKVVYRINGDEISAYEGIPHKASVDFLPYAGEDITLEAVLYKDGTVLSERTLTLSVLDESSDSSSLYTLLGFAFLFAVSVFGIYLVLKKINDIFAL